jgi:hypothetical protein
MEAESSLSLPSSLTLREEQDRKLDNRLLRKVFWKNREKAPGYRSTLLNYAIHGL